MSRKMKDSGIEWIGEMPEEWNIIKAKYCGTLSANGVDKKIVENEKLYKSVHYMDVYRNSLKEIYNSEDYLVISATESKVANSELKAGDVLFTSSSETPEDIGHSTVVGENLENTLMGYHLMRFRPKFDFDYHYEKYVFGSHLIRKWFEYRAYGMTRYGLSSIDFKETRIIYAPLTEQIKIANYLDSKSNLIDQTIEKQKQVIEKLESYKKSLITEAVTKGLNPNGPMKDTGIEWIGEIPEEWNIIKAKFCGTLSANGVDKKIIENEKLYKSVHYMDVYRNSLKEIYNSEDYLVISATENKASNCELKAGDVLFTSSSETPEDIGHSTVVGENLENTLMGYHLMRFRPKLDFDYHYEKYVFGSHLIRKWFEYRAYGMTRYGLSSIDFKETRIIYAPLREQIKIANYLDLKCNLIDQTIEKQKQIIEKLESYKKSLIYECVTGKREVL